MSGYALVVAAACGGAITLAVVEFVRYWRHLAAIERAEQQRDPGLSIVPAVADGTEPAVRSRRRTPLPKRRRGEALAVGLDHFPADPPHPAGWWIDDTTRVLTLRALDEATHELAHLHDARTEIH